MKNINMLVGRNPRTMIHQMAAGGSSYGYIIGAYILKNPEVKQDLSKPLGSYEYLPNNQHEGTPIWHSATLGYHFSSYFLSKEMPI